MDVGALSRRGGRAARGYRSAVATRGRRAARRRVGSRRWRGARHRAPSPASRQRGDPAGARRTGSGARAAARESRLDPRHLGDGAVVVRGEDSPGLRRPPAARSVRTGAGSAGERRVMRRLTHLGDAATTIGVGVVALAAGQARLGAAMLLANLLSHIPVQLLKRVVARPRPSDAFGRPLALVPLPDPFSFPSGHAAAATAVATTAAIAYPWTAPLALPLAALV